VVRYYTRIGLLQPAAHGDNGYRLYRASDAARLRFIRHAKQLGFTLKEIAEITQHAERGESPCGDVRRMIQHRIDENRQRIEAMQQLQRRMEHAVAQWQTMPDGEPDGDSICHLIESFDPDDDLTEH
jgi:DNA-binding transcriptional MerR regulator